jgi:heme/copper-type cytochrome/quinol oxidase subunit 1
MASYTAAVGAMIWTVAIVLPFPPFSYIPPIIVGGGPGTWFMVGYLLYIVVGFAGLAAFSSILYMVERGEGRRADGVALLAGLPLLYFGVTAASIMLGMAGFEGGYARSIQHASEQAIEGILQPYVNPITVSALAAVAGAGLSVLGVARSFREAGA